MFSRAISKILGRTHCGRTLTCRLSSSTAPPTDDKFDPAPLFIEDEVQSLLTFLTRIDYKKVVRRRLIGAKIEPPKYKFMTDEQLQRTLEEAKKRAGKRLQMPPVVKTRTDVIKVLSVDDALEGLSASNYVFTDISFGLSDRDRLIVVREPSGLLRHAKWEERDRINYVYFPRKGKEMVAPRFFQVEYLQGLLEQGAYEYVLDRACIQFEPDDPEYKRVTQAVYESVNTTKKFESLRSTRHFGPFAFHLVLNRDIDNLLCDILQSERIDEAVALVRLFQKIHPESRSAQQKYESDDDVELILHYARLDSHKEPFIEKLVAIYRELVQERQKLAKGIEMAHGIGSAEPMKSAESKESRESRKSEESRQSEESKD